MIEVSLCGDVIKAFKEKTEYDAIVHGCNCFCNFGKGISVDIRKTFQAHLKLTKQRHMGINQN